MAGLGPGEQAEQRYLVRPRALAGGGDIRHISEFLRASGWRDKSKKDGPLLMESPDRTVRVAYDPYMLPGGWTIRGKADGLNGKSGCSRTSRRPCHCCATSSRRMRSPMSAAR